MGTNNETEEDFGLRIFVTKSGDSFIGLLLEEQDDSFLICFPSRLLASTSSNARIIEPYMSVPYFRAMKYSIPFVVPIYGEFEYYFLKYMVEKVPELYPDFEEISPGHIDAMREYLLNYSDYFSNGEQSSSEVPEDAEIVEPKSPSAAATGEGSEDDKKFFVASPSKYKH